MERLRSGICCSILKITHCSSPDFMKIVFISHVRPILDFASVDGLVCCYTGAINLLEGAQRRWTKRIAGFQDLSYSQRVSS